MVKFKEVEAKQGGNDDDEKGGTDLPNDDNAQNGYILQHINDGFGVK